MRIRRRRIMIRTSLEGLPSPRRPQQALHICTQGRSCVSFQDLPRPLEGFCLRHQHSDNPSRPPLSTPPSYCPPASRRSNRTNGFARCWRPLPQMTNRGGGLQRKWEQGVRMDSSLPSQQGCESLNPIHLELR